MNFFLKKQVTIVICILISAVLIIVLLVANYRRGINIPGGFNRKFNVYNLELISSTTTSRRLQGFTGTAAGRWYFETDSPHVIYNIDTNLKDQQPVFLSIPFNDTLSSLFKSFADTNGIIVMAGNLSKLIHVHPFNNNTQQFKIPVNNFTRAERISNSSFVLRAYEKKVKDWNQVFVKHNYITGRLEKEPGFSTMDNDAGFTTDGLLHYNKKTGYIMYCFYQRSEILCFDTLFQRVAVIKTIEPMNRVGTVPGKISNEQQTLITNNSPSHDVHFLSCTNDTLVYLQSLIRADNEDIRTFEKYIVIDTYHSVTGLYKGSFYVQIEKKEPLQAFKIIGSKLIVIYEKSIFLYNITHV
jgi:hypothetical protein